MRQLISWITISVSYLIKLKTIFLGEVEQVQPNLEEVASVLFVSNSVNNGEESANKVEGRTTRDGLFIPDTIDDTERIVRTVYEPVHLHKKTRELKFKAFESPVGMDEMSVTRLEYSSVDFCKQFGKANEIPDKRRNYYGLAVLLVSQIRAIVVEEKNYRGDVVYSPIDENESHADIKLGWSIEMGKEYTGEQQYMMDTLVEKAKMYPDNNKEAEVWDGPELKPTENQ